MTTSIAAATEVTTVALQRDDDSVSTQPPSMVEQAFAALFFQYDELEARIWAVPAFQDPGDQTI